VLVRPAYSYLVVSRPGTVPLEIVAFVHGSRDPWDLRDRIGEPVPVYSASSWDGESVVDVPLNAREIEYVRAMVRSGRTASEGEVLREALQASGEREVGGHAKYDAWCEVRRVARGGPSEHRIGIPRDDRGRHGRRRGFMDQLRLESEVRRGNVS
jgi:Arc/MetJ-type ribon-helix-helix transcriptional regulator